METQNTSQKFIFHRTIIFFLYPSVCSFHITGWQFRDKLHRSVLLVLDLNNPTIHLNNTTLICSHGNKHITHIYLSSDYNSFWWVPVCIFFSFHISSCKQSQDKLHQCILLVSLHFTSITQRWVVSWKLKTHHRNLSSSVYNSVYTPDRSFHTPSNLKTIYIAIFCSFCSLHLNKTTLICVTEGWKHHRNVSFIGL